jgi:hypothetical protein
MSILSISILATFGAVSNNLRSANFSQDQVTAYYLADEGIEYIHNYRDNNGIQNVAAISSGGSVAWLNGIAQSASDPCYGAGTACTVDVVNNTVTRCAGGASGCPYLKIDPGTDPTTDPTYGQYGYTNGWTPTPFRRAITITVVSTTEAVVKSIISWTTNGVSNTYTLSETLESWQ